MRSPCRHRRRSGATVVEFAMVFPLLALLLLGIAIAGLGVFRFQQVAWLAREGARWASVHGTQYAKETGLPAASAADVIAQAITPRAAALDPDLLTCSVTWNSSNRVYDYNSATATFVGNTVTVTLNYKWTPEWSGQAVNLSSSSTVPMAY